MAEIEEILKRFFGGLLGVAFTPAAITVAPAAFISEAVKTLREVPEKINIDLWKEWVKTWKNILLSVHESALSPYPVSYEESVDNAARYLALSAALSLITNLASLSALIRIAMRGFR